MPARTAIDPADFASLLPQVFIAVREAEGTYRFRLAGELLIDLHGRGLRGENLLSLWARTDRFELISALESTLRAPQPLVIGAHARADGALTAGMEILFAPLVGPQGQADRFLGLYQPTARLAGLRGLVVHELTVRSINGGEPRSAPPRLRLAALDGRCIA